MKSLKLQFMIIKRFFTYMIPDKKRYMCIAVFAGLSMVFYNILSAYMLKVIYLAITRMDSKLLFRNICLFIGLLVIVFSYNCFWWNIYGSLSARITGKIRLIILTKICTLQLHDVEKHQSAYILSIITNELEASQGIYVNMKSYISTLLFFLIPTLLIFRISLILGLLITFLAIIQLTMTFYIIKPLEKQCVIIRDSLYNVNNTCSNILHNNMSIRLYCSEDFYIKISKELNKNLYSSNLKLNFLNTVIQGINIAFALLGYIIVLVTGGILIGINELTLPNLLFITQMRFMMIQGILSFSNYALQLQPAIIGARTILSFLEYDEKK